MSFFSTLFGFFRRKKDTGEVGAVEIKSYSHDRLWQGRFERPDEDAPGWEEFTFFIPMLGRFKNKKWVNPETGEVEWVDYPAQAPRNLDYLFIQQGYQNVGAPVWNGMWATTKSINEAYTDVGFARLREYKGTLRSKPSTWPAKQRNAFMAGHPDYTE